MNKSNYNNDKKSSPFIKGKRLKDVVKPKRPRYTRPLYKSNKEAINALVIDLVQILADIGICLKNVHTIAKGLIRLGWTKSKKIEG